MDGSPLPNVIIRVLGVNELSRFLVNEIQVVYRLKGVKIIADLTVAGSSNFITGANKKDTHIVNVNIDRDFTVKEWADIRYITAEDKCPKCGKEIEVRTAI